MMEEENAAVLASLCSMEFDPKLVGNRTGLVSTLENGAPKSTAFCMRLIGVRSGGTGYPILHILCKPPPIVGNAMEEVAVLLPFPPNFGTENRTALVIEPCDLSPLSSKTSSLTSIG
jgi:hypothetical protein